MFSRFVIAVLAVTPLLAQAPPEFKQPRELSPGVFEIGAVRLDKNANTVKFPARVNMDDGLLEYLMVSPQGSVHESLLVSEVPPQEVHMAMLLLGAKGMTKPQAPAGSGRIDAAALAKAPKLTGDRILITVTWKDKAGKEQTVPVERWIVRKTFIPRKPVKSEPAADGPWLYTGSYFYENRFLAQIEGCFGSLVTYPGALINNPRAGSTDDHVWFVNPKAIPPVATPVEFTIKLESAEKSAK